MNSNWSAPFYGIQHLADLKRGFQITVTNRDEFADCCIFVPGCGFSAAETIHDTIEQAREYGEHQAVMLNALRTEEAA